MLFVGGSSRTPNSRYLYIPAEYNVYQFDLWAADIDASRITVAEYDGFSLPYQTTFFRHSWPRTAKYTSTLLAAVTVLHVIHHPDEPGLACEVEQHGVSLPYYHLAPCPTSQLPPSARSCPVSRPPALCAGCEWVAEPQLAAGALRTSQPGAGVFSP
ncbi:MAG: hypothetical protein KF852_11210 [Saprospiraceae bacterium]|nr:hypothetical protein [Saprospiraceae bacterium]